MQALKLVVCLVVMWASVVFGAGCEFEGKQLKVGEWMQPKDKCLKLECKADGVAAMGGCPAPVVILPTQKCTRIEEDGTKPWGSCCEQVICEA